MAFVDAEALTSVQLANKAVVSLGSYTTPDGTDGNKFYADSKTILHCKNTNAATRTVTVHTNRSVEGLAVADDTFVIPANTGDVMYAGFSNVFHQNESGEVWIEFSAVTDVTVKVIQLP